MVFMDVKVKYVVVFLQEPYTELELIVLASAKQELGNNLGEPYFEHGDLWPGTSLEEM
jgi:hypothetical protein